MPRRHAAATALSRPAGHAIVAFVVFASVVALSNGPLKASILDLGGRGVSAEIAVEHAAAADMSIDATAGPGQGVLEIRGDAMTPLDISVPADWILREVRGAPLSALGREEPMFGFQRLTVPPGAVVSYRIGAMPDRLILHHPGAAPLQLNIRQIDLATGAVARDIVLIQGNEAVVDFPSLW